MPEFHELTGEAVHEICTANAHAVAESLNGCFNSSHVISCGEAGTWDPEALPEPFAGPGLITALQVGGQAMLALIPATLPLPDWWRAPDKSQMSRLQTLPMEWAFNVLPEDLETESTTTYGVEHIGQAVAATNPAETANVLPLVLAETAKTEEAVRVLLLWPVAEPAMLNEFDVLSAAEPAPTKPEKKAGPPVSAPPEPASPERIRPEQLAMDVRLRRLLNVPVSVAVRIAEKRINLHNVLMLSPGALLTFNKSCEDLLDLYVNNCHYGRGEAVKIGEKFGLKITDVGPRPEQKQPIIEA